MLFNRAQNGRTMSVIKQAGAKALPLVLALVTFPAIAQNANFDSLVLSKSSPAGQNIVKGYTRGTVPLYKVVGDRDVKNNLCVGFGAPTPDHVLKLESKFAQLKLQVKSRPRRRFNVAN